MTNEIQNNLPTGRQAKFKMFRTARIWIGATLLVILAFNYAMIGLPLFRKAQALEHKANAIIIQQVKSGEALKSTENSYFLEILKKATTAIEKKIAILNCISASFAILILSWTIFSVVTKRSREA